MGRTFLKDGRKWQVNSDGINSLTRTYVIQLDTNNLGENSEFINFSAYGVPAIGTSHPMYSYLKVLSYLVDEGEGSEKKLIKVTCNYGLETSEGGGSASEGVDEVEQWGWESGVDSKDVIFNLLDDTPILNSAGDPFEVAPTCDYPAPVFVKVFKTFSRKDYMKYNCLINSGSITIGSMTCDEKTLLANVSESRIFGDPRFKYKYTIQLRYKSNISTEADGKVPHQFGWDLAIQDCGMRELNDKGELVVIKQLDSENNVPCPIASPELLDGNGKAVKRVAGVAVNPYIIRVQVYPTTTFPSQFYSEPD